MSNDLARAEAANDDEPHEDQRTEQPADGPGAASLYQEQSDEDH